MNVKCECCFCWVRKFLLQVCFFILNTETNYTQFCGPCALVSPNFKHSSQFEIKFKKNMWSKCTFSCCCFLESRFYLLPILLSSLVQLSDIFPSRINGKYFQFQGQINKVFIETTELTFGKFFEMFSPRFAFKLFKLRRQTYPFET